MENLMKCPYCGNTTCIKYGKVKNNQRYKCKNPSCNKTFSDNTFSIFINSKKFALLWKDFLYLLKEGNTLQKSADTLKITKVTAFFWRHKILSWFADFNDVNNFTNYVELTKYTSKENFKGCRNITTNERRNIITISCFDSQQQILSTPVCLHFPQMKALNEKIEPLLNKKAFVQSYNDRYLFILSNKHNKIRAFLENNHTELDKFFSIKIHKWTVRFHGFATKYLFHYLTWNIIEYKLYSKSWIALLLNCTKLKYRTWKSLKSTYLNIS